MFDALRLTAILPKEPPVVPVVSPWSGAAADCAEAAEKHLLLESLALQLMQATTPWLPRVLEAAGAQVLVMAGHFYIALPSDLCDWVEVPALSKQLHLMPWAEVGEIAH